MRKFLTILLVGGLLCLCACGQTPQNEDTPQDGVTGNYKAAVAAIQSGDYRTAYDLLKGQLDEPSKELFSHFVFAPTTVTSNIKGEDYDFHFSTVITYDDKGNPLTYVHTDKGNKYENVYTYDDVGRLATVVGASKYYTSTSTYTYDSENRIIRMHFLAESQTNGREETTYTYVYDDKGNLTEEKRVSVYSDGGGEEATTTYQYNADGKETLKRTAFKSGSWSEYTTEYRADGTLYKFTERHSAGKNVFVNEYDEQERLWKMWIDPTDDEPYVNLEYTYDAAGRVVRAGADRYTYDDKSNLMEESNGVNRTVYTYDEKGNCLSRTRLSLTDEVKWTHVYTYDANGNVLTDAITYSGGYDESTTNTYDADGNRTAQVYTGYSSETGSPITITETVAWTLFYYPNEVPEVVEEELYSLTIPPNAA